MVDEFERSFSISSCVEINSELRRACLYMKIFSTPPNIGILDIIISH